LGGTETGLGMLGSTSDAVGRAVRVKGNRKRGKRDNKSIVLLEWRDKPKK
jgi:hypothetical protein